VLPRHEDRLARHNAAGSKSATASRMVPSPCLAAEYESRVNRGSGTVSQASLHTVLSPMGSAARQVSTLPAAVTSGPEDACPRSSTSELRSSESRFLPRLPLDRSCGPQSAGFGLCLRLGWARLSPCLLFHWRGGNQFSVKIWSSYSISKRSLCLASSCARESSRLRKSASVVAAAISVYSLNAAFSSFIATISASW